MSPSPLAPTMALCPVRQAPRTLRLLFVAAGFVVLGAGAAPRSALAQEEPPADTLAEAEESPIEEIELIVDGMVFDALAAGPEEGELVLLLHGFPQTGYAYRHQLIALAEAGYRAVAPNQRGYSPRARPGEVSDYAMTELVSDVLGMATALRNLRFHLVGHDWGAAVAWVVAANAPGRVQSLTALSTPHVTAFGNALADPSSAQSRASSYFATFRAPGAEREFLANDAARFRQILGQFALDDEAMDHYLEALGTEEALGAALNWYRAGAPQPAQPGGGRTPTGTLTRAGVSRTLVTVPTLYVWSTADPAFTRETADASAEYVTGPYRFEVLEGVSHWIPEEAADDLNRLLLEHLDRWRGR